MTLTVTLGAALITGIAGGTTAAATARHHHDVAALPDPTPVTAQTYIDDVDAVPPEVLREGGGRAVVHREPVFAAGIGAQGVHLKSRPQPKVVVAAGAAWVNPNPTARVTSCFGPRWGRQHEGVDMAAPDGTPIVAAGAGVVVRAGVEQGYGNAVLIDHGDGWLTHYGHLSVIGVVAGQRVVAGEQIGNEGSTGHSTGPHLHFEVHQGYYQNPVEPTGWMHLHGIDIQGCAAF
ncbi:M23 family metallopeptidase [Actinoplanes sp. NPDC026619]|uniref:M23 family metallopeptidase n=1 Tax=Actinoplanes sp. NPDC026619 TaxID=3155798 RepID=UPI0033C6F61C